MKKQIEVSRVEVISIYNACAKLSEVEKLPFEVRQCAARNIRSLSKEAEESSKLQQELLEEFAEKDEHGDIKLSESKRVVFKAGLKNDYIAQLKKIQEEEVSVTIYSIDYKLLSRVDIPGSIEAALLDTVIEDDNK